MLALVYGISVALNYGWELAQSGLFTGESNAGNIWLHCFVASLGDGIMVMLLFSIGWLAAGRRNWFVHPGLKGYAILAVAGVFMAVAVEWVAVQMLERWSYTPSMPLVPGIEVGLIPVLQMVLLPPLIFSIVAAVSNRLTTNRMDQ